MKLSHKLSNVSKVSGVLSNTKLVNIQSNNFINNLTHLTHNTHLFTKARAFTLAEVLITLGIIGVVAAVTLPVLITNINERVLKEQVRSAKYKLTLATDKMKSLGLLNEHYATTTDFVNELKKHFKIAKVCDNNNLRNCWPTDEIYVPNDDGTLGTMDISDIKTGQDLKALAPGTKSIDTVGIVTGDGTPMILVYSPKCSSLDAERTYTWSTIDGKPETNATTNCISAIMDVNGGKKPNRLGRDVRTWNSLLSSKSYGANSGYQPLTHEECLSMKDKLGINDCYEPSHEGYDAEKDYWGGAVRKCHEFGLHLPSPQTLAMIAGARYGRSDVSPYTFISTDQAAKRWGQSTCKENLEVWKSGCQGCANMPSYKSDTICIDNGEDTNIGDDENLAIDIENGWYWAAPEIPTSFAIRRYIGPEMSIWDTLERQHGESALCVGD